MLYTTTTPTLFVPKLTNYKGINISFLMHFAVDLSVIQSFLERKREVSSTDDDECTSNDDDYDSESTSTSGSGFKRGEYSYHDTGCPAIWLLNI